MQLQPQPEDTLACDLAMLARDTSMVDLINRPPHYTHGRFETISVVEAWGLGFHLGNVIKYISRAKHKGSEAADLRKAYWYLHRALATDNVDHRCTYTHTAFTPEDVCNDWEITDLKLKSVVHRVYYGGTMSCANALRLLGEYLEQLGS